MENNDPEDANHDLKQATGSHFKRLYVLDETWAYQESQGFGVKCGKQHDPSLKKKKRDTNMTEVQMKKRKMWN